MLDKNDIIREELRKKFKSVGPVCDGTVMVSDGQSEFHVTPEGVSLYNERYAYVGSFHHGFAWVRPKGKRAREFHIRKDGSRPYKHDFHTVGDFDGEKARASYEGNVTFWINAKGERIRPE